MLTMPDLQSILPHLENSILMIDAGHVMTSEPRRIAVLIDGDSIDPAYFGRVLVEADRHGTVEIRRIYSNHVKLSCWEECISNHGIESVPNSTTYKNAADVTMIIDAAEILHSGKGIDGFCIVTNDNDFAGLARWIREKGTYVAVIWSSDQNKHTPSFENEYDAFMYVADLSPTDNPDLTAQRRLSGWKEAVIDAIRVKAQKGGWARLSDVGNELKETGHNFDYRTYCHKELLSLVKSCPEFEVQEPDQMRLHHQ